MGLGEERAGDADRPVYAVPGITGQGRPEVLLAPVRPSVLALQQALDVVLAETTDDPGCTAEVAALAKVVTGAQAALIDRVDGVDRAGTWALDGAVSLRSWVSAQTRMTPERASETVRVARSLRSKPDTKQAFASADVRLEHVEHTTRGLDRLATVLPDTRPEPVLDERGRQVPGQPDPADWRPPAEVLAETEQALLTAARHLDARELGVEIRKRTAALAPQARRRDEDEIHDRRFFQMSKDYDGGSSGRFRLGAEQAAAVRAALDAWRRTDHTTGDLRTPGQRDADAFVALTTTRLDDGLPTQHGVRPHLLITVDWRDWVAAQELRKTGLNGGTGAVATYADGEPILPETLARLSCDSRLTRIVLDSTGRPLDVGITHRTITPAIFLAAVVRDGGCSARDCRAGPERCEGHHVRPVALGGETSLGNTRLLCKGRNGHHHQVHDHGRTIQLTDGTWIGPRGFEDPPPGFGDVGPAPF